MEAPKRPRSMEFPHLQHEIRDSRMEKNYFEQLPDEVLMKIFKFFVQAVGVIGLCDILAKVCTTWKAVSQDPSLWQVVYFPVCSKSQKRTVLSLCKTGVLCKTEELNFTHLVNYLNLEEMAKICAACPRLKRLTIRGCEFRYKKEFFDTLSRKCVHLSHINISGSKMTMMGSLFDNIFTECGSNIVQLRISETFLSGPKFLSSVANHCANIQELDMSNLGTTSFFLPIEDLQEKCPQIRSLCLANTQFCVKRENAERITKSPGFINLEEISLAHTSDFSHVSEDVFSRILKNSSKLKLLDIRGCMLLSSKSVILLPATDLEHIFLYRTTLYYTGNPELIMAKYKHSLKEVDLSWNPSLKAVKAMLENLMNIDSSPLEILDLTGTKVTLSELSDILCNLKNLCSLNLQSCRYLERGLKRTYCKEELVQLRQKIYEVDTDTLSD